MWRGFSATSQSIGGTSVHLFFSEVSRSSICDWEITTGDTELSTVSNDFLESACQFGYGVGNILPSSQFGYGSDCIPSLRVPPPPLGPARPGSARFGWRTPVAAQKNVCYHCIAVPDHKPFVTSHNARPLGVANERSESQKSHTIIIHAYDAQLCMYSVHM